MSTNITIDSTENPATSDMKEAQQGPTSDVEDLNEYEKEGSHAERLGIDPADVPLDDVHRKAAATSEDDPDAEAREQDREFRLDEVAASIQFEATGMSWDSSLRLARLMVDYFGLTDKVAPFPTANTPNDRITPER